MAQIVTRDKAGIVSCVDFLAALYRDVDSSLWLEVRLIDPKGERPPKALWSPVGKPNTVLREAKRHNAEGYGVYFAPCPRNEQRGSAEAAAVLPALWVDIDCDGDAARRDKALANLQTFSLGPSVIVDSGGGWHVYWFLAEPFTLADDEARQHAANLLKGLFATLGGDEAYVKSVASVMRLPGLVNTKPERGGATVSITHFEPETRYPVDTFEPFIIRPKPRSTRNVVQRDEHAPLPRATLDYLAHGAAPHERNHALFNAACQFRDAGYSQSEAEHDLIPRYVADGPEENPTAREREAGTTIESVYRHAAREPLSSRSGNAQDVIGALVAQYGRETTKAERPTTSQIAEAVGACAELDHIAWVDARKRIKTLCGDDFRLVDLDRMYKQVRREFLSNRNSADMPDNPYIEVDGRVFYERRTERGVSRQPLMDWTAHIVEWIAQASDEGQTEHINRIRLVHPQCTAVVDVPGDVFADANALCRFIAGRAGGIFTVRAGMNKHLPDAINKLSAEYPRRNLYRFMGWTQLDEHWIYLSPGMSIGQAGVLDPAPEVELETRLRDYHLTDGAWEKGLSAFSAVISALPKTLAPALIAYAMLPLLQRFFPSAAPRPALHLVGTTGSGKSEIASLLSGFYGAFTRDTPPSQWGDTINAVEALGYALADALYWVDDYKSCYADERAFTRLLQNYSRGMGRVRLNRDSSLRRERPCRGLLLSTGETTLEGEASVLSRMLVLEIPPWEKRDPGGKGLADVDRLRGELPVFTAHFARWIAARADTEALMKELADGYAASVVGYREKLNALLGRRDNTGRMIGNWAVLVTVYRTLRQFLEDNGVDDVLPAWSDVIVQSVQAVQQERAGQVFLNALGQLLASGEVMLGSNIRTPEEPRPGITIIGYVDGEHVLLLPDIALRAVSRVQSLKFDAKAIGVQLREEGLLIPGTNSLTVQRRVRNGRARFWQLKALSLACDSRDTETDADV